MPVGFSMICLTMAEAEDATVTTRKIWTTWKTKYAFWVNSSTRAREGSPASLAQTRVC
jgi:hypothetical protein